MRIILMLLFILSGLFANILETGIVIVDNKSVAIPNEANFYTYINQIGDTNLTEYYRNASKSIDRLENPYEKMINVKTYEDAFGTLDYFYTLLIDENNPDNIKLKQTKLQNKIDIVVAELLEAKRLKFTDHSVIILLAKYNELSRQFLILSNQYNQVFKAARNCTIKILGGSYSYAFREKDLVNEIQNNTLNIKNVQDSELKHAYENANLIAKYRLLFIQNIHILQTMHVEKTWRTEKIPSFTIPDMNISTSAINPKSPNFAVYDGNYTLALCLLKRSELDNKVLDFIVEIYQDTFFGIEWNHYIISFQDWWVEFRNYSLFVFDNNSIQVQDIFSLIEVIIITLCIQWLIVFIVTRIYKSGVGQLFSFVVKTLTFTYLVFYISTKFLGLDATNLAMFASAFSLAIGFGMQSLIQNFVAGIIMIGDKTIKVGDTSLSSGQSGVVTNISYRTTTIRTEDNTFIMLPNSKMILEAIENKTKLDPTIRVQVPLFIDYNSDIPKIETILNSACKQIEGFKGDIPTSMGIHQMNEHGIIINFALYVDDATHANTETITKTLYNELQNKIKTSN